MKKARIILGVVAILAVVGGTFASKAAKRGGVIFTNTTTTLPCTITVLDKTIRPTGQVKIPASTTTAGVSCPLNFTAVLP